MTNTSQVDPQSLHNLEILMTYSENDIIWQLGAASTDEYTPPDVAYRMDYFQIGSRLWKAFQLELYQLLCDPTLRKPKEWVNDLIGGDIRNLATGIILAIKANWSVSMAIVVPAAALILKQGVRVFCEKSLWRLPHETVKVILEKTKMDVELQYEEDTKALDKYFERELSKRIYNKDE